MVNEEYDMNGVLSTAICTYGNNWRQGSNQVSGFISSYLKSCEVRVSETNSSSSSMGVVKAPYTFNCLKQSGFSSCDPAQVMSEIGTEKCGNTDVQAALSACNANRGCEYDLDCKLWMSALLSPPTSDYHRIRFTCQDLAPVPWPAGAEWSIQKL